MRKTILGGIALTTSLGAVLASGAFAGTPDGQGAQKSALQVASGDATNGCNEGTGASSGWAILNAPGKVGAVQFINGEVHLTSSTAANQVLDIWIGEVGSNMCVKTTDTVTTNAQGIGNGHINCQFAGNNACAMPAASGSRYFVVLTDHGSTNERFASTDVPLK